MNYKVGDQVMIIRVTAIFLPPNWLWTVRTIKSIKHNRIELEYGQGIGLTAFEDQIRPLTKLDKVLL